MIWIGEMTRHVVYYLKDVPTLHFLINPQGVYIWLIYLWLLLQFMSLLNHLLFLIQLSLRMWPHGCSPPSEEGSLLVGNMNYSDCGDAYIWKIHEDQSVSSAHEEWCTTQSWGLMVLFANPNILLHTFSSHYGASITLEEMEFSYSLRVLVCY